LAQSSADDHVLAGGLGEHRAGLSEGGGPDQGVETADDPDSDEERGMGQLGRHLTGRPENADQNGVADQHRHAEREAEDPVQPASARGGDGSRPIEGLINAIGGFGQLKVRRRVGIRLQAKGRDRHNSCFLAAATRLSARCRLRL
jgi:hypothetical protein